MEATSLGMSTTLQDDFDTALAQVIDALKAQGFGVLTQIDVKSTLKEKLGSDFYPYRILGACNPRLAHRALTAAPEVGLLLPCNVTVSSKDGESVDVAIIEPLTMVEMISHPELAAVAEEAHQLLERVIASLQE